jgi:predicted anti-sigma-YlaC factor YlaD
MITCRDVQTQLSLIVDGLRPESDQEAVRVHLESCAACRGALQDLERLRRASVKLGPIAPPDHVWLEVAGRIRMEPRSASAHRPAPNRAAMTQWIGLAAALVLVTLGAYFFTSGTTAPEQAPTAAGNVPPAGTVEAVAEELSLAMLHYERAIAELETLAKADAGALDPAVATTLQQNIQTIDQAIAESRGALTDNPGSVPARESLFEALRRKVVVLQATVTLMNEMRKGNPAGAAEAAGALGKKS